MECPSSPMQFQRQWICQKLEDLPDDSTVTLTVEEYRDMIMRHLQLHDLIASQQKLLEKHVPDY